MYVFERLKKYQPLFEVWLIDEQVGSGSYSEVYKMHHKDDASIISALKVIPIPKSANELDELRSTCQDDSELHVQIDALTSKYKQEIDVLNQLKDCPNIVRFLSFNVKAHESGPGRDILLQMEHLTALPKLLQQPVSVTEIMRLGIDICTALDYLQKANMIHRDIKPDNILYSPESGQYKLGDFGLAKLMELRAISSERGTPLYNAPEIEAKGILHKGDIRSDLYSLGLVMYLMLNHNLLPFIEKPGLRSTEEARIRRLRGEPFPPPSLAAGNEALISIILKACAYHAVERYPSAALMKADLESLLVGKPMEVKRDIVPVSPSPITVSTLPDTAGEMVQNTLQQNTFRQSVPASGPPRLSSKEYGLNRSVGRRIAELLKLAIVIAVFSALFIVLIGMLLYVLELLPDSIVLKFDHAFNAISQYFP